MPDVKTTPKVFGGALSSGLPLDEFQAAIEAPESVHENMDHLRPMISAVRDMTLTKGWQEYIKPFLEKNSDPSRLIEIIKDGGDAKAEVMRIEAYKGLLNVVGTMTRTAESLSRLDAVKEAREKS